VFAVLYRARIAASRSRRTVTTIDNRCQGATMKTTMIQTRPMRVLVATAMLALAGGMVQTASAMPYGGPGGYGPGYGAGPGYGHHRGGGYGPGMGMQGGAPMMGRWLDGVNASAEQKAQIQSIWQSARTDMQAIRQSGRALRQQMHDLLAQPTVDANAVEALRQQMLAQHDRASKRMTQAMLDAGKVLTPEQRKQLADQMTQRRAMMERHRAEREAIGGGPRRP
jgi:Spy/CpxP family protein refolding chaperone